MLQRAAEQGQHIVNSYNNFTYLNYSYEYDSLQATYEFKPISLQRAYEFKPVPENFPVHLVPQILGASCQMWGECRKYELSYLPSHRCICRSFLDAPNTKRLRPFPKIIRVFPDTLEKTRNYLWSHKKQPNSFHTTDQHRIWNP